MRKAYKLSRKGELKVLYSFCSQGGNCVDGADPAALTYVGAAIGLPYDGKSILYSTAGDGASGFAGMV